ncbi:23S rRNA (guanosine(2251)-2'-O)-methyltransferase RlmB [bacterium]|nr:23S rRNA (guanosine(2251)-2'-O)-methyltransferase RlmB [bacterium]
MEDIVYGRNAVWEVIKGESRQIEEVQIVKGTKGDRINQIIGMAKSKNIAVHYVNSYKLNKATQNQNHQGVVVYVGEKKQITLPELLESLKQKKPFLCLLDQICDPHNVGAIIRSAYLCGVNGIIIPERHSAPVTATVEKASAGTAEMISIVQVTNLSAAIKKLKENNFWIIGARSDAEKFYFDQDYNMNCAVVLGGENQDISTLVKKNCDILVKIPLMDNVNSLNVPNAASILIYELVRQRILKNRVNATILNDKVN